MAFVPGFDSDVFVSYAHADNEGPHGDRIGGWVAALAAELQLEINRRLVLPKDTVKVFTDYDLPTNKPITPELLARVRGAAVLLVVMSPYYLASDWCMRERNAFLDVARDRIADGRVFIVKYLNVDHRKWPAEFGDYEGDDFGVFDPVIGETRPVGKFDHHEPQFRQRIYQLSGKIADTLKRLAAAKRIGSAGAGAPAVAATAGATRIFLARATDDLEDREVALRNHLVSRGLQVSERRRYSQESREAFEAAVLGEMAGCRAFAQVLNEVRGPEMAYDEPRRLPVLLAELARKSGLPVIQWRDRKVDPANITDDEAHRALVDGAMACGFDEFAQQVYETATAPPKPAPATKPAGVVIFVDHLPEPEDSRLAEQVRNILNDEGFEDVYLPVSTGDAAAIEESLEMLLEGADGVIEVFGSAEAASVQVRFIKNKARLKNSKHAVAALAIVEGPPGDPEKLAELRHALGERPGLLILDSAQKLERDKLAPFIDRLRAARARNA